MPHDVVDSPLTGKPAKLIGQLSTAPLIAKYRERFGYDASACFSTLTEIGLYECQETGFKFYFPFSAAGPESLYRQLEKFEWNYKESKWEHDIALPWISPGARVLDVGCGRGAFLRRCLEKGAQPSGIELNKSAAEVARSRGVEVFDELLSAHASRSNRTYDVVTHFQVLEHVTDPLGFLADCVRVLAPNGLLLVGVPNDDGFVGQDDDAVLNQPPHHMGLWSRRSLTALTKLLPLSLEWIETEPLAEIDWYQAFAEHKYLQGRWRRSLYYRLGMHKVFRAFLDGQAHTINGHTIIARFRKLV